MSICALSNRSLASIGGLGALSAVGGGVVCFKAAGTAAVLGGIFAVAGVIALVAVVALAAYRYYATPAPDEHFLPPLVQKPVVFREVYNCIAGPNEKSSVSRACNTVVLVKAVASFLSAEDTVSVERTCVAWSQWACGNLAWKPKCDQEGIPPIKRKGKGPKILSFYKEAYLRLRPMIFGPKQYSAHLGVKTAGEIRRLKDSIHADICRLDPSYIEPLPFQNKAQRKYRLFYLSREIEQPDLNGAPAQVLMTINRLGKLACKARRDSNAYYKSLSDFVWNACGEDPVDRSDWVLMSSEVVPGTRSASYPNQVNTVSELGARPPKAIEVIALNFFDYFRFGTYLFGDNPQTYSQTETTLNHDRVIVGGFDSLGLLLYNRDNSMIDSGHIGMAAAFSCGSSAPTGT